MEEAQNSANLAFESYLAQDYKVCMETLNKLKSGNLQNEKDAYRIKQNLFAAEFIGGKTSTVSSFLNKIEELFQEIRPSNASSNKSDLAKSPGDPEEDLSGGNVQEIDESGILRYNYAVALQLSGKRHQSASLLEEIFQNKDNIDDYVLIKASLTLLEIAITQKDYPLIKLIMDYLERIRKYIGSLRAFPLTNADSDDESDLKGSAKDVSKEKSEKDIQNYNSLIFGSEISKHGIVPSTFSKQEFNFILSVYQINLLLSMKENELAKRKLSITQGLLNNLSKSIKEGKDEKGQIYGKFASNLQPYINRHAHILFSFAEAHYAYQVSSFNECMKTLNTIEILTFSDHEILSYTAFQLNNMGCCHLKMKKYSLAAYYLAKALNILQKLSKETSTENKNERLLSLNALQFYPIVLHNYALTALQTDKKNEAIDAYSSLAEFWPDNAKVWYRTGLCHINKSHEILNDNQSQRKNGIYQSLLDVPNYTQLVEEEKAEQLKQKKTEEIDHKENPYYTRYVLQPRESTFQRTEEDFNTGTKFVSQTPDINKGNDGTPSNLTDKELKMHFEKASKCFRNAVLISKKKKAKLQKEQTVEINFASQESKSEVKANENEPAEIEEEKERKNTISVKSKNNLKEYQDILQSSLVYLAYSSLSQGEINNTINYAKECLELPSLSEENKYICINYLVEAFCVIGNQKEAINIMNLTNVTKNILNITRNALGINQAYFNQDLTSKVVIYTNLASAHILNGNLTGAQNAINIALSNIDQALTMVPISLLNLMIYLNLRLDKPEIALQILKRRRVNSGNNKLLLRIVKWMS